MDRRSLLKFFIAGSALPISLIAQASQTVRRVTLGGTDKSTKLLIELSGSVIANTFSLESPPRLVVDLKQASLGGVSLNTVALDGSPIVSIRSGPIGNGDLRLERKSGV